MDKELRDELLKTARENGAKYGKNAELDFGAGAEWMYKKLAYEPCNRGRGPGRDGQGV